MRCGPATPHQGGGFGSVCLSSISPTRFSLVRVPISFFLEPGVLHFSWFSTRVRGGDSSEEPATDWFRAFPV